MSRSKTLQHIAQREDAELERKPFRLYDSKNRVLAGFDTEDQAVMGAERILKNLTGPITMKGGQVDAVFKQP